LTAERYQSACVDIHQHLDHQHFCRDVAVGHGSHGVGRGLQPDQNPTLGVDRLAVNSAELIPAVHVGRRNLMTLEGLQGERPGVVDPQLFA
jgi:hypothetical protein